MRRLFSSRSVQQTTSFLLKPHLFVGTLKGNIVQMDIPHETMVNIEKFVKSTCEHIGDNLKQEDYVFVLMTQNQKDMFFRKKNVAVGILGGILSAGALVTIGGFGSIMWLFSNLYH